jgi:hypothetical protein
MGLFDVFSGDDERKQFQQGLTYQTNQIGQADNKIDQNFELARGDLRQGQNAGMGYLTDQNAIARGDIAGAQTAGQNYLTGGVGQAAGIYDQALSPWEKLSGVGTQGVQDHYNLISNPDSIYDSELYKSREAAGIDALNRGANARGMLASGNNTQDQIDYMRRGGLEYFGALANQYAPYFGMAQGAAAGIGNILGQKAGMYDQLGRSQAGLAQWGGGQLSGLADQLGVNQSNLARGTAGDLAGNRQTQGQTLAGNRLLQGQAGQDMYMNSANAQTAADSNMWGAILGLGGALSGGLGNYVGSGGRF